MKIKTEYLSQRCVICHQTDMFNPQTDDCGRCGSLDIANVHLTPASDAQFRAALRLAADESEASPVYRLLKYLDKFGGAMCESSMGFPFFGFIAGKLFFMWFYVANDMWESLALAYFQIAIVGFIMGLVQVLQVVNQVEACTALFESAREVSFAKK